MKNNKSQKKIRYAVVGLGHIAQVAVLPAFKNAKANSELVALVTGDPSKAKKLMKKYKTLDIVTYDAFDSYLATGSVDAVFIALPNDMHYEYTKIAINRGVHVLCEKPFTLESSHAKELQALADEKNVKLMVGYRLHFEAANLKAVEIAQSKQFGDLKYFTSHFSFQLTDPDNIRLKAEKGGGPIWDIGIYCINAARYLFRDEPIEVMAMGERSKDRRFKEVDETVSVILRFPQNRLANFVCSFGSSDAAQYSLYGTKGHLHLQAAYEYSAPRELAVEWNGSRRVMKYKKTDQFGPEISYFSESILKNRRPEPSGLEGYMDVRIIEAVEESLRTKKAVSLERPPARVPHSRAKQKIVKPALKKVEPIQVDSPHS